MGTLVFVCPTTGHEVSTGVEVDRSELQKAPENADGGLLSALSQEPYAAVIWAWFVDDVPERADDSASTKSAA